jgi:hypothetical protein
VPDELLEEDEIIPEEELEEDEELLDGVCTHEPA